ncbi:MAG: hypothetical protein ACR2LQ_04930 [Acidimicrobiales bacterium]
MEELYPALVRPRLAPRWDEVCVADDEGTGTVGEHAQRAWRLASALRTELTAEHGAVFSVLSRRVQKHALRTEHG